MENKEEVFQALEEFGRKPVGKVPALLDEYLKSIAHTGETLFPWPKLKPLFIAKLEQVMNEFLELCPPEAQIPCPNVENVKFQDMRQRLLDYINLFNGAPFTIQRLCELLSNPRKHYRHTDKFLRGIEKNVMVVSTVDPFGKKIVRESKVMVNGLESNGHRVTTEDDPDQSTESASPAAPCECSVSSWFNNSMAASLSASSPPAESSAESDSSSLNRDQENGASDGQDVHCEADGDSSTSSESESPLSSENEESMDTTEAVTESSEQKPTTEQIEQDTESAADESTEIHTTEAKDTFITSSESQIPESSDSLSSTQMSLLADSTSNQSETQNRFSTEQSPEQEQPSPSAPTAEPSHHAAQQDADLSLSDITESAVTDSVTDTDVTDDLTNASVTDTLTDAGVTDSVTCSDVTDHVTCTDVSDTLTDSDVTDSTSDTDVTDGMTCGNVTDTLTDTSVTSSKEGVSHTGPEKQGHEIILSDTTPSLADSTEKPKDWSEVVSSSDQECSESSEDEDRTKVGHGQDTGLVLEAATGGSREEECVSHSQGDSSPTQSISDSKDSTSSTPSESKELHELEDKAVCSTETENRDCTSEVENVETDVMSVTTGCESDIVSQVGSHSEKEAVVDKSNSELSELTTVDFGSDVSDQTDHETSEVDCSNTQPDEEPMDMN